MSAPNPVGLALQRILFLARWIMAPIYLCMAIIVAMLAVKFVQELVHTVPLVFELSEPQLIAATLNLVDLTLVANLLTMVSFVGYENFVAVLLPEAGPLPAWLAHIDFSALKLKVIASIISIAAVDLLKRYLAVTDTPREDLILQAGLFLAFVVAGVLLALMDRLSSHEENR